MLTKAAFDAHIRQISALQTTAERLIATIEEKNRIISEQIEIILNLNRAWFGQSSEKRMFVSCDGQLSLFKQAGDGTEKTSEDVSSAGKQAVPVFAHTRKPKRTMKGLVENVPKKTVIVDLPQEQKFTADDRPLKCIGTDDVQVELIREPGLVYK